MEDFIDILKVLGFSILVIFAIVGIACITEIDSFASDIEYYENNIKINAIKYQNEIYLKKGE